MRKSEPAVITDGRFFDEARSGFGADATRFPDEGGEAREVLGEALEASGGTLMVYGADDLVSRVVSTYWGAPELGALPLSMLALDVGDSLVAPLSGNLTPTMAQAERLRGGQEWQKESVGTLKVTASTEAQARYGFSFAVGWIHRAYEARQRRQEGAGQAAAAWARLATDSWRQDDGLPVAERLTIDRSPRDSGMGSLVATTLPRTFFGLGGGAPGVKLWAQLPTTTLIRQALTPEALDRGSPGSRTFSCVHLDGPAGWVLDGQLLDAEPAGLLQVVPGPAVTFLRPPGGLRASLKRWMPGRR